MNQLTQIFAYNANPEHPAVIRTAGTFENPLFVAADVCQVLGIANHRDAIADFPDDEKGVVKNYTLGGQQDLLVLTEPGLYRLVFRSSKPEAERFRKWVFSDVLPAIRKTGRYSVIEFDDHPLFKAFK